MFELLADLGGADDRRHHHRALVAPRMLPWAMALWRLIIGLPMFFGRSAWFRWMPVIYLVARRSAVPDHGMNPGLAGLRHARFRSASP